MEKLAAIIVFCLVFTGCNNLTSTASSGAHKVPGLAYYLPETLIQVSAKRIIKSASEITAEHQQVTAELIQQQSSLTDLEAQLKVAEEIKAELPNDSPAAVPAQAKIDELVAEVSIAKSRRDALEVRRQALTSLLADTNGESDSCTAELTLSALPVQADTRQVFHLLPEYNALRDDELSLSVGNNGLLNSTDTTTEGRTGQILINLASSLGALGARGSVSI